MTFAGGSGIQCPQCGQPVQARLQQTVDVGREPAAKARLLSGQLNTVTCPNCGYRMGISTPLLYHDGAKEMLLVYVPMELGLQQQEQERLIGDLVKGLMNSLPAEQRRGYMLQPQSVLTMQGLIEKILAADGVTPEMIEAQRSKARLVETFLQVDDEEGLVALIAEHDDQIDMEFFTIMDAMIQNTLQTGRPDLAQQVAAVRDYILEHSTAGKSALRQVELQDEAIQDVAAALEALGPQATREDFMNLVLSYAGDEERLQALVGLQYPLFDYSFFQELGGRIEQAGDGEKAGLQALRDRLLAMSTAIHKQQEALAQAAVAVLREILDSEDIEAAVRERLPMIDDTFMAVLSANVQHAEQQHDFVASARLKQIYETALRLLRESVPPEFHFISELLEADSLEVAQARVEAEAATFGPGLLQLMDTLIADLAARGDEQLVGRLVALRQKAADVLGTAVS
ncbi:MAG: CpXC domain-containing protein [Anaerolineae bacterium]|nr:CpXC domain-containing protein [Anaerolineae bacterium]